MKTRLNLSELLSMWTSVVHNSFTEDDWNENLTTFAGQPEFQLEDEDNTTTSEHGVISYIRDTWLVHKQKFVSAWTKIVTHLGSSNTFRVEGAYAYVKSYIQASNLDIDKVFTRIDAAIKDQRSKLDTTESKDRIGIKRSYFRQHALFTPEICDRLNQSFMSLEPHQQIIFIQMASFINCEGFFNWKNAAKTNRRDGKRRGRGGRSQSSTQRDPSAFEHATQRTSFEESQESTLRKCGRCSLVGHNEDFSQQQQQRQQQTIALS
ncbi:hypothetical protein [Parasitella parasitica]|uniref:Uncharacterized protein n=1 Tax=Parasitella parasitica TaxID=35722 RepID=A0A0B7N6E5_9FUNG|nr:hypothetical protein [Parasitella parasitica]